MSSEKFKVGDFVWAKMKGYPHWPAKIVEPTSPAKASKNKASYYVYFFGSKNYAWILDKNIIPHSENVLDTLIKKRSNAYQQAIDEFMSHVTSGKKEKSEGKKKVLPKKKDTDNESIENESNSKSSKFDADDDSTESKIMSKSKTGKKKVYKKRPSTSISAEDKGAISKTLVDDDESDSTDDSIEPFMHSSIIKEKRKVLQKKKRISNGSREKESSIFHSKFQDDDHDDSASSKSNEPLTLSPRIKKTLTSGKRGTKVIKVAKSVTKKYKKKGYRSEAPLKTFYRNQPMDIDFNGEPMQCSSSALFNIPDAFGESSNSSWGSSTDNLLFRSNRELDFVDQDSNAPKDVERSKSIGFLGLEEMGELLVKRFLDYKLDVTLWKKEVLDEKKYEGAKIVDTQVEMVSRCDVIFSYYSDRKLFKENFFGEMGVMKGFEEAEELGLGPKGFVLLKGIDKETAEKIIEAITVKKGLYLEATICGNAEDAKANQLLILASGHMKLYNECKEYLNVIAKKSKFLESKNPESGISSTEDTNRSSMYSVIVNMLNAALTFGVGEIAMLTEKLNIPRQDSVNVLEAAVKNNFGMDDKLDTIEKHAFNRVHTPLRHAQKDLHFCLKIADSLSHPMPVASTTNQIYQQAKLLNYSDCDVTSVYKIFKY